MKGKHEIVKFVINCQEWANLGQNGTFGAEAPRTHKEFNKPLEIKKE